MTWTRTMLARPLRGQCLKVRLPTVACNDLLTTRKERKAKREKRKKKMWSQQQQQRQRQQQQQQRQQQQQQLQQQPRTYLRGFAFQHPQQQNVHLSVVGVDDTPQHQHQHHHQLQHHTRGSSGMDLPLSSNPRASRNMAEKQRRDNLNTNISTMAALVPTVAGSSRRMDKISILRLTAAYLRTQYTLGRGSVDFLPKQFNDLDVEQYFVDNLIGNAGFFIVVTTAGKIVYVSRQVERQLGHAQKELTGQSLYHFVYPEDHEELTKNLTPDEMQPMVGALTMDADNSSNSSEESTSTTLTSQRNTERRPFREQRRSFKLRMSQRTVSRREHTQYECLHVSGVLRLADACKNVDNRARHRETTSTSNDIIFVGMAWLPKKRPITELSIIDANKQEYVTRHLVDGRIIYCDHRISIVAGYLSEEVSGLSAFSFMHKDDVRWTIIGLRQMYDRAEPCGSSCYRLLSKTGEFIYLRTHGYLEYDKDTQTVESFVCINTLVSEEEGIEFVREMKERFSATVSGATKAVMIQNNDDLSFDLGSESQKSNSKASVEDPSQLEDAITHLISDLPSPAVSEDRSSPSPMPNTQFAKAAVFSQRLPPAATQASKFGIKKIDHNFTIQGNKGNLTPKQEPRIEIKQEMIGNKTIVTDPIVEKEVMLDGQQRHVGRKRNQDRNSIGSLSSGKPLSMKEMMGQVQIMRQENRNNESIRTNVLPERNAFETKVLKHNSGESGLENLGNGTSESEDEESRKKYSSKRIYTEENAGGTGRNKKRRNEKRYETTEIRLEQQQQQQHHHHHHHHHHQHQHQQQQSASYVNCRTFIKDEQFSTLADFDHYDQVHTQPIRVTSTDSTNSSLQDVNIEYQELDSSTSLVISNMANDEQFGNLQELKEDPLLSSSLDANPDFMLKIFDDLRPAMGFEKSFDDMNVQQLTVNNQQAVNDEIRRTHLQLASSMVIRESQFDVLARDLDNPALQAQRKNLTQLQVMSYIDCRLNIRCKNKS
ncbi:circadian locomoter output cycles protein kaput-like isoform X3 [Vespula pensylvanica]|uniref:circadian locomoter output cycles protein kaput-like isoform X3 n=1 Tax=Vespula pensylvanica TaxID=30213 RepID=UPI001CBA4344|nr:circadian locomoter output cycles protein kaput-like isoform X3 [Vespula pensylvanica]